MSLLVVTAFDPTRVKDLTKQEYIIADATASSKIICWEENVGLIEEGHSYKLSGLNVRTFRNEKYLSVGKDGFSITEIDNIGEVSEVDCTTETKYKLHDTVIQGVKSLECFYSCYSCTAKVVRLSDLLGECTPCNTTQKFTTFKQRHCARVDLQTENSVTTVSIFSPDIALGGITKESLLTSEPFTASIANGIFTLVSLW